MAARAGDVEADRVISIGADADDTADVLVTVRHRDRLAQRDYTVCCTDRVSRARHVDQCSVKAKTTGKLRKP